MQRRWTHCTAMLATDTELNLMVAINDSENGWQMMEQGQSKHRIRTASTGLFALAAILLVFAGCGDPEVVVDAVGDDDGDATETTRYDELPPLELEAGEAKEGLHLLPGIELIDLSNSSFDDDISVDTDEMTVTVEGDARDHVEESVDEIWSDDILMGDGFIFLVVGAEKQGDEVVFHVEQFELLRVVHGEWDFDFEHEGANSPLWMTIEAEDEAEAEFQPFLEGPLQDLEGSALVGWEVSGGVEFPVDWSPEFEGRVSFMGYEHNADYECETYTETRTRRRFIFFGEEREEEVEVEPDERFCVDRLLVKGSIGMKAEALAALETSGEVNFEPSHRVEAENAFRTPLGSTGLALWMEPYLEAGLEMNIEGETRFEISGYDQVTIPLGFEYDPHDTGFSLLPNENYHIERDGEIDPELTARIEAYMNLYTQFGVGFTLSDAATSGGVRVTGPEAGIELGAEANAVPVQYSMDGSDTEPCLTAALYVKGYGKPNLRAEAWAWGVDLIDTDTRSIRVDLAEYESEGGDFCLHQSDPDDLEIRLRWSEPTLNDLYVQTPGGAVLSYDNNTAHGGQYRTVDLSDSCLEEASEECVAFTNWDVDDTEPPEGEYEVWAEAVHGEEISNFTIEVETEYGLLNTFSGTLSAASGDQSDRYNFTIGDDD